jgi:hypothetical protein
MKKIVVQSQRDPIRTKGRKEKSSMQNNQSYDVFCARYDKLQYNIIQHNTYMVENIAVVFLLTDNSRR